MTSSEEKNGAEKICASAKDCEDISDGVGHSKASRKHQQEGQGDQTSPSSRSKLNSADNSDRFSYKMNHKKRGTFIIINNKVFNQLPKRDGTDVDAANLHKLCKSLGFDVTLVHNKTAEDMFKIVRNVAEENHSDRDCFGLAVLSHGEAGVLFGVDGPIQITDLIGPIKNCNSLAGKPKLFFFQACRGEELDHGQMLVADGPEDEPNAKDVPICIPIEADFLYAYSTTPGYFSWRSPSGGSWFIQALVMILSDKNLRENLDIGRLLNRVCHMVAYEYESYTPSKPHRHAKKQVPSIVSMLTKDLYLK